MPKTKKRSAKAKRKGNKVPTLKSGSGSGFSFEDKVTAFLFCEMLIGKSSLGTEWGTTERIERQAQDWEPFGDLLLTVSNRSGKLTKCGCSVKSNRQINANGCNSDLCAGLWALMSKSVFNSTSDMLGLFCTVLSNDVSPQLNQFCKQAREEDNARRLDEKITHAKHRKIYGSFQNPADKADTGLPRHVLAHLIPREFDFEDVDSRNEASGVMMCREILRPDVATDEKSNELWQMLLTIARELRDAGGSVTRERLASKLRIIFVLKDDPSDIAAWALIRRFSQGWLDQVRTTLPGDLILPRSAEFDQLSEKIAKSNVINVLGESGCGKSALVKRQALEASSAGGEFVWVKAGQYVELLQAVPNFEEVLARTRRKSAMLVFDALESCYDKGALERISRIIALLSQEEQIPWKIVLVSQTSDWSRVSTIVLRFLSGHPVLNEGVVCGDLSKEDLTEVSNHSASIARLMNLGHLRRVLGSVKMLDVLLSGRLDGGRTLADEADLVQWWWDGQVKGDKQIAAEENIARFLSGRMADDLVTEVSPEVVSGSEEAVSVLIQNGVLRRTQDGRIRFDHDLLADWSRVMYLRSIGSSVFDFMVTHIENPPWLRAIRLLSQHMLERTDDLGRWRAIVKLCLITKGKQKEPTTQNLQVLEAWLEGIVYCAQSRKVLEILKADLLADEGELLRRLVQRLLHVGTIPDPVLQKRARHFFSNSDDTADTAGLLFRLPILILWLPLLEFLAANKSDVTDLITVELSDIAAMWSRLEEYTGFTWSTLADMVLLNAEKELRREVAGEYRADRSRGMLGPKNSRVAIYTAGLQAATQYPERAAKLALKAAGRAAWEDGDLPGKCDGAWLGEWHDRFPHGIFSGFRVNEPAEAWPDGPKRRVSHDFSNAWMESGSALKLYAKKPEVACEVTLSVLIDWPKSEVRKGSHEVGIDRYGFTYDSDRMFPAFWTKGNFIGFLRQSWQPALDLIVKLVDFATARYEDWWPYEAITEVTFSAGRKTTVLRGNSQVYAWHRYHMNTPHVVTCALMALEKWLDEQVEAGQPIDEAVRFLYRYAHSLAFAGVLVSIGKRHPALFFEVLKPLLFVRQLYFYDLKTTSSHVGGGFGPIDGKVAGDLRREWENLPGRTTHLKEYCLTWLFEVPKLQEVLCEVCESWRQEAANLSPDSEEKLAALRMAADFDRSLWKEVTEPDGSKSWECVRPLELQDKKEEERIARIRYLLAFPTQCSDWLDRGRKFTDAALENAWQLLQNWTPFEQLGAMSGEKEDAVEIRDHRHSRAGLLAILLCTGESWLAKHSGRREWLEAEVLKILTNPPKVTCYTPDDIHDDYESLLARAVVRSWSRNPADINWRGYTASMVTAYRYRTVLRLFQEAFILRKELGPAYKELEAFAQSFSVARHKATQLMFLRTRSKTDKKELQQWGEKWLPAFAQGHGPKWVDDWSSIENLKSFPHEEHSRVKKSNGREEVYRRDYGLDMGVMLTAFGQLPSLAEANGPKERDHWFRVCVEFVAAFCRTLPSAGKKFNPEAEWHYDHWKTDDGVFEIVARRLFECKTNEREMLWKPIVGLPLTAHHHICSFLSRILIEFLQVQPSRTNALVSIWKEIATHVFTQAKSPKENQRNRVEVQSYILLYGTIATRDELWSPLVEELRPWYKMHLAEIRDDARMQSSFVNFLSTKTGDPLLVDAMVWLQPGWDVADNWFWRNAVEDNNFSELLEYAWRNKFSEIRANPIALKAFKILTLKLAAHYVPIAMEIQQQIGL